MNLYCDNDEIFDNYKTGRAVMLALPFAALLSYLGDRFVWGARVGNFRYEAATLIIFVLAMLLAVLIKAAFASAVRMQAARLDDNTALRTVLHEIERGMTQHSERLPNTIDVLQRRVRKASRRRAQ